MRFSYQQIEPAQSDLVGLIKLYYLQSSQDEDGHQRVTYYPNFTTTINIHRDSSVQWSELSRVHKPEPGAGFLKLLVGKFDKSREIIWKGPFEKLTIVFHPLGLNHFVARHLSDLIEDHFSFFEYFGPAFDEVLHHVFACSSMEARRNLLDTFFAERILGFDNELVKNAVNKVMVSQGTIPIGQLAQELFTSRKTLLRQFRRHLAMPPTDFRSIVRFRNALQIFQNSKSNMNLSSLAYASNYYDQSDLNSFFRQKTGLTPRQLFDIIKSIDRELYWNVEDVPKVQEA